MLTVAGVVAKNNMVVDVEQKTIVNSVLCAGSYWCAANE